MDNFNCNYCDLDIFQGNYLNHLKTEHKDLCSGKNLQCRFCLDDNLRTYAALLKHVNTNHAKQLFTNSKKKIDNLNKSINDLIMDYFLEFKLTDKQGNGLLNLLEDVSNKIEDKKFEKVIKSSCLRKTMRNKKDFINEKTFESGEKYYMIDKKKVIQKAIESIDIMEYIDNNILNLALFLDGVLIGDAFHGRQKRLTQLHVAIKFLPKDIFFPSLRGCSTKNMFTIGLAREKLLESEDIKKIVHEEVQDIENYVFETVQRNSIKAKVYLIVGDNIIMQKLHGKPQYWGCLSKFSTCRICSIIPNDYKNSLTCFQVDENVFKKSDQILPLALPYVEPMHDYINGIVAYISYSIINVFIIVMTQYEKNYSLVFTQRMMNIISDVKCTRLKTLISEKYFCIDSIKKNVNKKGVFAGTAIEREYIAITFKFYMEKFSYDKIIKEKDLKTIESVKRISILIGNLIKLVHDCSHHSSALAVKLENTLDELYSQFFTLIPGYKMSFKFHTALHGPYVLRNTGHFSNINCFGFETFHRTIKKVGIQFAGGHDYSKTLLAKVNLIQEEKLNSKDIDEGVEIIDKMHREYEYIEPTSLSNKSISLNDSYRKDKLFNFTEEDDDSDMEID